jgi:hypothetical protein
VQRGHPPALRWFAGLTDQPGVPGFVAMELVQAAPNARLVQAALKLISPLPLVWPREVDCARALTDFSTLHLSHGLGLIDALIAATATGHGAILCTFNVKHYQAVPSLPLLVPYRK